MDGKRQRPDRKRLEPPTHAEAAAAHRSGRRLVIGGIGAIGALLAGLVVGIPALFPDAQPKQRFDNRRIIPPLLRARMELRRPGGREADQRGTLPGDLDEQEALLVLSRVEMRDWNLSVETPAQREMLEVTSYLADDIWRAAQVRVAVVPVGGAPDARLIAAQGNTAWVWADQLVAAGPGFMGKTLDQAELARLNPELDLDRPGLRGRLSLAEALVLDGTASGRGGFAFDPATRIAHRRSDPRDAPLPPLFRAAAFAGPALAREGRVGATWFGLLPAEMAISGAVAAQDAGGAFLPPMPEPGPMRLWRGRVRDGGGAADVLEVAEPVAGVAPLPAGGLLVEAPGRLLAPADPPSILLAQIGAVGGMEEWVRRIRPDGTTLWEATLPTAEHIAFAMTEPGRLWLLATPDRLSQTLHAIALADGRILRSRPVA
ncbi:hypothetical protein DFH01_27050 [Falsiroseomonas bella]|uniref:Uncharacterized protein n=1 Tax=Falsiroseomonas bella TaxID=2184016 RepID=A0A317F7G5_9PROT|nr:hypothetical protein [Falsiroseomonas bella]PWS33997.1 hypothetical protein DFH01_27050 [Falsiroseomonas bella]